MKQIFTLILFSAALMLWAGKQPPANVKIRSQALIRPEVKKIRIERKFQEIAVYSETLADTRMEVRLNDDFGQRNTGLTFKIEPQIFAGGKIIAVNADMNLTIPQGGVFFADPESGVNESCGFSLKKSFVTKRDSLSGIFRIADKKILLPVFYGEIPLPRSNPLKLKNADAEIRILRTDKISFRQVFPSAQEIEAVTGIEPVRKISFRIQNGNGKFSRTEKCPYPKLVPKNETGLTAEIKEERGGVRIRLKYIRIAGIRRDKIPIVESFEFNGNIVLCENEWNIPIRIQLSRAGENAAFEDRFSSEKPTELIVAIRIANNK